MSEYCNNIVLGAECDPRYVDLKISNGDPSPQL